MLLKIVADAILPTLPLLYEVTATVRDDLIPDYERYMRERHIPDVLATGRFTGASLTRSAEGRYRISYELADRATLERYLNDHAPALRADFARHFPTGVELSREVWSVAQRWGGAPSDSSP